MTHKIVNGVQVPLTQQEILEMEDRELNHLAKLEEQAANQYKLDRKNAYPSIEDQLDLIYHQGIDAWKAQIATIKATYPKPTEK